MKQENTSHICTVKEQIDIRYVEDTLYVLHGKWRLSIIISLYNGNRRYREIARSIPKITFTMLSKELKFMELNNLVKRSEDPDFPKTVEYELTEYSESLYPIIEKMLEWGKFHRKEIT